jgi:transcriptional regulator with XRE-family HTH domain
LTAGYTRLIEAGKRSNIGSRTLDAIARVLGVSLDWLIRGDGQEPTDLEVARALDTARRARRALARTGTEG